MKEWSWKRALDILRIWEYTGKIRRGYFVSGMSGAQFIESGQYAAVTAALKAPEEKDFLSVPGMAAALCSGTVAAVMERQGKTQRVWAVSELENVMKVFVQNFKDKKYFPIRRN